MWVSLFTTLKAGHSKLARGDYGAWTDAQKDWKTCQHLFSTWSEGHLVHESCKSPDSSIFCSQGRKLLLGKCRDAMVFVPIQLSGNIFILCFQTYKCKLEAFDQYVTCAQCRHRASFDSIDWLCATMRFLKSTMWVQSIYHLLSPCRYQFRKTWWPLCTPCGPQVNMFNLMSNCCTWVSKIQEPIRYQGALFEIVKSM